MEGSEKKPSLLRAFLGLELALGLRLARWGSLLAGLLLLFQAIRRSLSDVVPGAEFLAGFYVLLALLIVLPWSHLPRKGWLPGFLVLAVLCVGFAFAMIFEVMFIHDHFASQGEKPGVPGFHGTLIFLVLMQPAVAIFSRYPHSLE